MARFLFGMGGRISRGAFCVYVGVSFAVLLALMIVLLLYSTAALGDHYERGGAVPWPSSPPAIAATCLWFAALFAVLASGFAVSVRRLHDRGRSWLWIILFALVPNGLSTAAQMWRDLHGGQGDGVALALYATALTLTVWAFVELACLAGDKGANRFGPDPKPQS
jgi:uncharacterized membrane protein YhaH (DUF805 family)